MPPNSTLDFLPDNLLGNPARPLVVAPGRASGSIQNPRDCRLGELRVRRVPMKPRKLDSERSPLSDLRRIGTVGPDPFGEPIDMALHQGVALGARVRTEGLPHPLCVLGVAPDILALGGTGKVGHGFLYIVHR